MASMDGGGSGFSLFELMAMTAEDRRWFIQRLHEEKEKEKEKIDEQKNSSPSLPNSLPNL